MAPTLPYVENQILTYQRAQQVQTLKVGTPAWYRWLETATAFFYTADRVAFTARREQAGNKRGGWYWRAYLKHAGKQRRVYLGRTEELTPERLSSLRSPAHPSASQPEPRASPEATRKPFNQLPSPLTALVGREREVAAASALLLRPEVHEVTLTGSGGVGKTRLALEIAAGAQAEFPDGICFVSLAAVRDAELVLPAIAHAEGLQETGSRSSAALLQAALRDKRHLLVLDNFEHVIAAAPGLLGLLSACPQLKMLVTSREVLRVRGEREFVVQPLALPDPRHVPDGAALAQYGAVELFLERAREIQPAVELSAQTTPLIAEICRRLDGLPLALELAAARLKLLSLQALLDRLEHSLEILTRGPQDLPARQQTMRRTIAWSYDLLSPEEQRLFRLLSVFASGCTLEAAETVYSMLHGRRAQLLDTLTSVLDKHLIYQGEPGTPAPRLLLHETVREYGVEALAANQELEMARQAHAQYYLGQAAAHLGGVELAAWLKQPSARA